MAPPLLSVADARAAILAHAETTPIESVALWDADDRILANALCATRTQPPFDVSAMDGFAVRAADIASLPAGLKLIGESAAGHGYNQTVGPKEAVRIFTGAPVPDGADAIVIQENTSHDATKVTVEQGVPEAGHIRTRGFDFTEGQQLISSPRRLNARDITLAAAMGHAILPVRRRPRVALLATGDELVLPGEPTGPDQIVAPTRSASPRSSAAPAANRYSLALQKMTVPNSPPNSTTVAIAMSLLPLAVPLSATMISLARYSRTSVSV